MSRRKTNYAGKGFESKGKHFINQRGKSQVDTSANIFESMLQSKAFKSLKPKQQILYVYCKAQYYGKRKPKQDYKDKFQDDSYFYFNWQLALDYGLYTEKSHSSLYHDMQELIKKGFIERAESGKGHKTKSVYRFSNKWQEWE